MARQKQREESWYLAHIQHIPRITAAEEARIVPFVVAGDAGARKRMVEAHLHLVVWIARKYVGWRSLMELVEVGNVALFDAIAHFRVGHGARFRSYAQHYIRSAMCAMLVESARATADNSAALRQAFFVRERCIDEAAAVECLQTRKGISRRLATAACEYWATPEVALFEDSLAGEDAPTPEELCIARQRAERLRAAVAHSAQLSYRERKVIERVHLESEGAENLSTIARAWGLTRSRTHQNHSNALQKLRTALKDLRCV